jgi:alkylresorcinol/alkylpyrone synthase
MANMVASGLFGYGAAAVVLAGEETEIAKRPTSVAERFRSPRRGFP